MWEVLLRFVWMDDGVGWVVNALYCIGDPLYIIISVFFPNQAFWSCLVKHPTQLSNLWLMQILVSKGFGIDKGDRLVKNFSASPHNLLPKPQQMEPDLKHSCRFWGVVGILLISKILVTGPKSLLHEFYIYYHRLESNDILWSIYFASLNILK